jgi:hypothetical protein
MKVMSFSGNPVLEFLPDGRNMRLYKDFSFADTKRIWLAPAGCIINGASIPTFLWSVAGSPFVGMYRNAAVLHDYFCGEKTEPWREVHAMFKLAMIVGGVSEFKATYMFQGVYTFGPRWDRYGDSLPPATWEDEGEYSISGG